MKSSIALLSALSLVSLFSLAACSAEPNDLGHNGLPGDAADTHAVWTASSTAFTLSRHDSGPRAGDAAADACGAIGTTYSLSGDFIVATFCSAGASTTASFPLSAIQKTELASRLSALRTLSIAECIGDQGQITLNVTDASGVTRSFVGSSCGVLAADALEGQAIDGLTGWLATVTSP